VSQKQVYDLLESLGGRATTGEISKLALAKYPGDSLYQYVSDRLHKLEKWGYVKHNEDRTWEIIAEMRVRA
jgi:hypothetical protein